MSFFSLVTGRPGPSGFGSASTAEQVTQGIDASNLTVLITGICMLFISFVWFNSQLRVFYCDRECFFLFKNEYFLLLSLLPVWLAYLISDPLPALIFFLTGMTSHVQINLKGF